MMITDKYLSSLLNRSQKTEEVYLAHISAQSVHVMSFMQECNISKPCSSRSLVTCLESGRKNKNTIKSWASTKFCFHLVLVAVLSVLCHIKRTWICASLLMPLPLLSNANWDVCLCQRWCTTQWTADLNKTRSTLQRTNKQGSCSCFATLCSWNGFIQNKKKKLAHVWSSTMKGAKRHQNDFPRTSVQTSPGWESGGAISSAVGGETVTWARSDTASPERRPRSSARLHSWALLPRGAAEAAQYRCPAGGWQSPATPGSAPGTAPHYLTPSHHSWEPADAAALRALCTQIEKRFTKQNKKQ